MDILRDHSTLRKCKLCEQEKPHYTQGIYIVPVCDDCMATLPPVPAGKRRCPTCLTIHNYPHAYCKSCSSSYRKEHYDYDVKRDAHLRRTYGITAEEYDLLFFRQAGLCAICKHPESVIDPYTKQPKSLVVDHDHQTG